MIDNLHTGDEARIKLISGIKKVSAAVAGTMGTGGANSVIEMIENPGHLLTNDGFTIASSIKLADPIEEMGRKILLEAISRANKASGDGSSTTTVLTSAILEYGMSFTSTHGAMDIKRSLEDCIPLIEKIIKKQTRQITVDEVGAVASISAEDEHIGKLIQEIYQKIGKDGIIHWDISKTSDDSYSVGNGITIEGAGFYSPYMCDVTDEGASTNQVRLKNATILVTKQKISNAIEFAEIGQELFNKNIKDLVVFCDEVDPLVVPDLLKTRLGRGFRFVLVKMPTFWKEQWYEDIVLASGASIIDPLIGKYMKDVKLEDLGTFENIIITKEDTYIDGIKDLTAHIESLKETATDDSKLRMSRLNTKTARLFIGAHSDSALSYKRLKVEDAISAAYQALQNGIVAGGGVALLNASHQMPDTIGGAILKNALYEPFRTICQNANVKKEKYQELILSTTRHADTGIDSRTQKQVDMFDAQITDPANIVLNAVRNSISVAASILTANTVVTFPRQNEPL